MARINTSGTNVPVRLDASSDLVRTLSARPAPCAIGGPCGQHPSDVPIVSGVDRPIEWTAWTRGPPAGRSGEWGVRATSRRKLPPTRCPIVGKPAYQTSVSYTMSAGIGESMHATAAGREKEGERGGIMAAHAWPGGAGQARYRREMFQIPAYRGHYGCPACARTLSPLGDMGMTRLTDAAHAGWASCLALNPIGPHVRVLIPGRVPHRGKLAA
jgi:hypothetical protein